MELKTRLMRVESKLIPTDIIPEHHIDLDQCISILGLIPEKVREFALKKGSSLAEATSEMLGIDFKKFRQELHKALFWVKIPSASSINGNNSLFLTRSLII